MNPSPKITLESLGEIDQREIELLHWIRTRFRYGEVLIETRDGRPYRISKATEYTALGFGDRKS